MWKWNKQEDKCIVYVSEKDLKRPHHYYCQKDKKIYKTMEYELINK